MYRASSTQGHGGRAWDATPRVHGVYNLVRREKTITQTNVTTQNEVSAIREAQTNHSRGTFVPSNDRTPILLNSPSLHSSINLFI